MKKISKQLLALLTAIVMIYSVFATPIGEIIGFTGEGIKASAASYTTDYRNWSQGASDFTDMKNYGCWVTAQAKMLQEAGMTPDLFNPDVYLKWQQDNDYIDAGFYQTNGTQAPCEYAKSQGYELTHIETVSWNIKDKIWENINNGYYTILYVTYPTSGGYTGTHYVMIANELSKKNNEIWIYNSYTYSTNAKPTTLASNGNWTLRSVRSYKKTYPSDMQGFALGGRAAKALQLNWTKNATADGYIIEQYKSGKWTRIAKITNPATTTYRVTGLVAGTAYKFRMKAYKMKGADALYSSYTSTLSARTNLSKVSGLKLGGRAADALRLNWTKNTSADGYIIEQYKDGKWVRIARIAGNATTTYRVEGLKASTQYKFRVKAYKMSGKTALYSKYSNLSAYTNPSKVANLKITGKAKTALRLGWSKNTSADGYIVEMYKGGKWVRAAKITSNATVTFLKSGLKKGTTYKFRVRTYNMVGKTALYGGYVNVSGTTNK